MTDKRVYKICLTGGPCAGKTTALSRIVETFAPEYAVYTLPEVATMTFSSGVTIVPDTFSDDNHKKFTEAICQMQVNLEAYFESIAETSNKKVLIVSDRGVCDNFVYCSPENKRRILGDRGWSLNFVCNERYDLVIHLVTAANGAAEFFTYANNAARWETAEHAVTMDNRGQKEWMSHPNFVVIDNSKPGFDAKIKRVLNTVASLIGTEVQHKMVKKFLLKDEFEFGGIPAEAKHQEFTELTNFLLTNSAKRHNSVVKRVYKDQSLPVYFFTSRLVEEQAHQRIETHKIISEKHYSDYLTQTSPSHTEIRKEVAEFVQQVNKEVNLYRVEKVSAQKGQFVALKVIRDCEGQAEGGIPDFIPVVRDITADYDFFTYNFSCVNEASKCTALTPNVVK